MSEAHLIEQIAMSRIADGQEFDDADDWWERVLRETPAFPNSMEVREMLETEEVSDG